MVEEGGIERGRGAPGEAPGRHRPAPGLAPTGRTRRGWACSLPCSVGPDASSAVLQGRRAWPGIRRKGQHTLERRTSTRQATPGLAFPRSAQAFPRLSGIMTRAGVPACLCPASCRRAESCHGTRAASSLCTCTSHAMNAPGSCQSSPSPASLANPGAPNIYRTGGASLHLAPCWHYFCRLTVFSAISTSPSLASLAGKPAMAATARSE